jgi:glycosyltransferase involved in cell wall biosynthesis
MKVAIDTGPLSGGHAVRGVGVYTRNLVNQFKFKYKREGSEVTEFSGGRIPRGVEVVHYPYFDLWWRSLPLVKRKPTVVTIHDVTPLVYPEYYPPGRRGRVNLTWQKLALRGVKAVVTDSECSKRDIHKYLGVPLAKIHRVYLAGQPEVLGEVSEKKLEEVRENYKLPERFVLYVGDVNWNKNLTSLVEAVGRIKNQELRIKERGNSKLETGNLKLVVVGKQAVAEDYDREHIENLPLAEFQKSCEEGEGVLRLGFVPVEDLGAIYRLATCYSQPSYYEGFGLVILEAMSAGCPVVCTKGGSLPEIGGKAAIYTGTTAESLAKGIEVVLGLTEAQRKRLVQEGKRQAEKFSWEKCARKMVEVYGKVVQNAK